MTTGGYLPITTSVVETQPALFNLIVVYRPVVHAVGYLWSAVVSSL